MCAAWDAVATGKEDFCTGGVDGAGGAGARGVVTCDLEVEDAGAWDGAAAEAVGANVGAGEAGAGEEAVGADVGAGDEGAEVSAVLLCGDAWGCDGLGRALGGAGVVTLTGRTVSTFGDAMK